MSNTESNSLSESSVFDLDAQIKHIEYKIVVALERISEAFRVLIWDVSKDSGLSPIQLQILIFLLYHTAQQRKVSFLADEFNMTRPTISDSVRILFKKGLIEKEREAHDKRSYVIHLTDEGERIARQASSYAQQIAGAINPLTDQEKTLMLQHLLQAMHHLQRAGVITPQRMCFSCRYYEKKNSDNFYCKFLEQLLPIDSLRVDCPEHEFPD